MDKAPDAFRTISEVADDLDVPQHVLRFWETRFAQIKPMKRGGGRRYYRPDDVDLLRGIRHLLYGEGYTIRGVQRIVKENGVKFVQSVWRSGAPQPPPPQPEDIEGADGGAEPAPAPRAAANAPGPSARVQASPIAAERGAGRRRAEPQPAPASGATTQDPAAAGASLAREHLRTLQAALSELAECKRLLEAALKDE